MMRDTFFSMPRFATLCRKELMENWKTYLLRSLMLCGILMIVFLWRGYFIYDSTYRLVEGENDPMWLFGALVFLWGFVILSCISASLAMERMSSKTGKMVVLLVPASMFEKFLSRWLIVVCGFVVVYLLAFKLADWTRVLVYTMSCPNPGGIAQIPLWNLCCDGNQFYQVSMSARDVLLCISGYLLVQSFFFLGSVIWPKNSLVKTFVAVLCIFLVYVLASLAFAKLFLPTDFYMPGPSLSEEMVQNLAITHCLIVTLFNWVLAYYRFKESEIIERW